MTRIAPHPSPEPAGVADSAVVAAVVTKAARVAGKFAVRELLWAAA